MYVLSFFKSLFRPRNFLPTLYFLANAVFVFFIFYILPFEIVADEGRNRIILGLIGLGVNTFFIFVSLTPMGEAFWRLRNNVKKKPDDAFYDLWQTANEVFDEVKAQAMAFSRGISRKVTLYYTPSNDINAFALGHRTVVLTHGILSAHPEYLKGVLAHELGHIAHGDSDLKLGINVSNSIITIFMTFICMVAYSIVGALVDARNDLVRLIGIILNFLINIIILGLFKLWSLLGVLCVNLASRKAEFQADGFADDIGFDVFKRSRRKPSKNK